MSLGKRLLQARKARGMRQREVADLTTQYGGLVLTQQSYQKLESRGSQSSVYLFAMAMALRVNPEWLQTGRGISGLDDVLIGKPAETDHVLRAIVDVWVRADHAGRKWIEEAAKFVAKGNVSGRPGDKRAEPQARGGDTPARLPAPRSSRPKKSKVVRLPSGRKRA